MGFVGHGIQSQHDAGDLIHPGPGGGTIKQTSPEHIVNGPVASFVDGVPLRMVGEGQQPLDPQRALELPPDFTHELAAPVGQEVAWSTKIGHDMAKEGVAHRARRVIASRYQDCIPGVAIDEHDEELKSAIGR